MTGQIAGGMAVPFPAHQAFDGVAFFHIGAFIQPVIRIGAEQVTTADAAVASTYEQRPVRRWRILGFSPRKPLGENIADEVGFATDDPVGLPLSGRQQRHHT